MTRKIRTVVGAALVAASALFALTPALSADVGVGAVDFKTIGDGSYKRVLENGITLGIGNDPPFTFQDDKTKDYDGIDVRIFKEVVKRLGIEKVQWEIVQFDALFRASSPSGGMWWSTICTRTRSAWPLSASPGQATGMARHSPCKRATRR